MHTKELRRESFLLTFLFLSAVLFLPGCMIQPDPISEAEHWQRAQEDRQELFAMQSLPTGPVSLEEAIARSIKYNLDHRLATMEAAFHLKQLDAANLQMLPSFAANAGYTMRSKENASTSIGYYDGLESLRPSYSTEKRIWHGDLGFHWSLLDFGLSYFQAKQQANRFLILEERRRRIVNNLVKEVITTYARVATAERLMPTVQAALADAESALANYEAMEQSPNAPRQEALEQQRAMINIISQLRRISLELENSRSRLSALMSLPPGHEYTVVAYDHRLQTPPQITTSLAELESLGLYLRPDLREEAYQQRIDCDEVKKEIVRMVPGVRLFATENYDSNKYLVNQAWTTVGATATFDIIQLASKRQQYKSAKIQAQVAHTRRLAGSVAALVQINLSYYQYQQAVEMYRDAQRLNAIEQKVLTLTESSVQAKAIGAMEQVRQKTQSVIAQLGHDSRLLDVYTAWANLYFSVGGDLVPAASDCDELETLTGETAAALECWLAGTLPAIPEVDSLLAENTVQPPLLSEFK
ncbi:MAG: TolC family protein [Planctomycetes bacterium]|nr:TolC family protein [Planctomycetota bacterium]